jgi:hypothetical protein
MISSRFGSRQGQGFSAIFNAIFVDLIEKFIIII